MERNWSGGVTDEWQQRGDGEIIRGLDQFLARINI